MFAACGDDSGVRGDDSGVMSDAAPAGCTVANAGSVFTDSCVGETVCLCPPGEATCEGTGLCVAAFPRTYRIAVITVMLSERKPDGACWDAACGAPDPFVEIRVGGTLAGTAPAFDDVFNATWDPPFFVDEVVVGGTTVEFMVNDEDLTVHDQALICRANPLTIELVRGRVLACSTAAGTFAGAILPR
jgi:hypothetical protein